MINVKGFVTIANYINNSPGEVSKLGELSTWSLSYTRERGEYSHGDIPGYKLHTFKAIDASQNPVVVADLQVKQILAVVQAAVAYATSHIRPYDPIDFRNHLIGLFFNELTDLELGRFVDNGIIALPEYIRFISTTYDSNEIKVWLADESFSDQYDQYEIYVVPPLEPLDRFFGHYNQAVSDIQSRTMTDLTLDLQNVKQSHPETYLRFMEFDYVNQNNTAQRTKTIWSVIIYGRAGDQIDIIKDALADYIIHHSTYSRLEWSVIFPDIFKRTEFILLPRWDQIAIDNLQVASALYQSMLSPVDCVVFAESAIDFYPTPWIQDNLLMFPVDYKAIVVVSINGVENVTGNQRLDQIFPDYLPVSSTSLDFNRMQVKTREWVLLLEDLLLTAETMTQYSSIPSHLRRVERNGLLFISVLYEGVNYLMAARQNAMYQ